MKNVQRLVVAIAIVVAVIAVEIPLTSDTSEGYDPNATPISSGDDLKSLMGTTGSYYRTADVNLGTIAASSDVANPIITVPTGVEVTLDLNGFDIEANIDSNEESYAKCQIILNQGTLHLIDTSAGDNGQIINTNDASFACTRTVKNDAGATLTIEGIGIVSAGAVGLLNLATCTIDGDSTVSSLRAGYSGGWDNACAGIENRDNGVLNIKNGHFTSVSQSAIFSDGDGPTTITGGVFEGSEAYGAFNGSTADTNVTIRGGTFSSDPAGMVGYGFYVVQNEDGDYEVLPSERTNVQVSTFDELVAGIESVPDNNIGEITIPQGISIEVIDVLTVPEDVTIIIESGATMVIPEDAVVILNGFMTNNGTLDIQGFISNPFSITDNGTIDGVSNITGGEYGVNTAMDLMWLSYLVDTNPDSTWNVDLNADITMPEGVEFTPIGAVSGVYFSGEFNGNGHFIEGLRINSTTQGAGFFYALGDATVSDLELRDIDYTTHTGYIGGVAYVALGNVTLSAITVSGSISVTGTSYGCGGMIASVQGGQGEVTLIDCHNNADIGGSNAYNIGSMFGTAEGCTSSIGIYNCTNTGAITAAASVGQVNGWGKLSSGVTLEVIGFTNTGAVNGATGDLLGASCEGESYITTYADGSQYKAVKGSDGVWTHADVDTETVATIDGAPYTSLSDAISAAVNEDVIVLEADVEGSINVDRRGINFTIDLNGHSITGSEGQAAITITECNGLIFEDSSGDHSGSITAAEGQYCIGGATASVTFKGGTFRGDLELESDTGSSPQVYDGRFSVDPNDWNVIGNYMYIQDEGLGLYVKVESALVNFIIIDTVSHEYDREVEVPLNSVIDPELIPDLPENGEGYEYIWWLNGEEWDPTAPITDSINITGQREYSFTIEASPTSPEGGDTVTLTVTGLVVDGDHPYDFVWSVFDGTDYVGYDVGNDTGTTTVTQSGTYNANLTVRFPDGQTLGNGNATIEVVFPQQNTITYTHDGDLYTQRAAYVGDTITSDMLPPLPTAPEHYNYVWVDSGLNPAEGQAVTGDMTFQSYLIIEDVSVNVWTEYSDGTVYLRSELVCPVEVTVSNVEWRISGGTVVQGFDVAMSDIAEDYRLYVDVVDSEGVPGYAIWVGEGLTSEKYKPEQDENGNYQTDTNTAVISPEDFDDYGTGLPITIDTVVVIGDDEGTTSGVQTTIAINGTIEVEENDIVIESKPVSGTVPVNVPESFAVAVDVTVGNVVDYEMTIFIPIEIDEEILGALAYYYNENTGFLEQVRCAWNAATNMVDIFTDHNTDYYVYLLTESSPTAPEIPQPSDSEPEQTLPPWGWDDDDDYVPPIVPAQSEDSGDDNTTTIVACAAAAVVAALIAAFLILDRRH